MYTTPQQQQSNGSTPMTPRSWAKVVQSQKRTYFPTATSRPTNKPMSSPNLGFSTTLQPRSKSPSPAVAELPPIMNSEPVPTPPEFPHGEEAIQTFSEKMFKRASQERQLIDPFHVEVHVNSRECPQRAKEDIGEIMKIVLEEIHVVSNRDYFFNGNVVLCYTVFPYRRTLDQVKRRNLRHDLAWRARLMWKPQLASALARTPIDLFPCAPSSPAVPQNSALSMLPMDSSCSNSSYLEPSQSPYLDPLSSSCGSAYQKLVQPAVTHLVSKTKTKRAKGLPIDYRARQNLVQLKHDRALSMLRPWLLDETSEKIYLRGDNVAFIQVKCPRALHAVDDFLERILNDESIEIVRCTAPLSRKRQGQLKGYLLYLTCKTAAMVTRIIDIFNTDFAKSGLKCKTAKFDKNHLPLNPDSSDESSSFERESTA